MTTKGNDYPGKGMLVYLLACFLIGPLTLAGIFWANTERLGLLDERDELYNNPSYPFDEELQNQAKQKKQQADLFRTLTVILFVSTLIIIGITCYSLSKLQSLHAWQAEWERLRYYMIILGLWLFAIITVAIVLLLLGLLVENKFLRGLKY